MTASLSCGNTMLLARVNTNSASYLNVIAYRTKPVRPNNLLVVNSKDWNKNKRNSAADGYQSVDSRRRQLYQSATMAFQ